MNWNAKYRKARTLEPNNNVKWWKPKKHNPKTTKQTLKQKDEINIDLIKKNHESKKTTRNKDWENVMIETKKLNKILRNVLTDNISELNVLIYAGAKLSSDHKSVSPKGTRTEIQNLDGK